MIEEELIERCCCPGNRLQVINLSEESDAVDLLGGSKPFDSIQFIKEISRELTFEQVQMRC